MDGPGQKSVSIPVAGAQVAPEQPQFRRVLKLRDLIFYGIIIIQPTAPMPVFGVVSQEARGHVVTAVLIAMVAMLFTAMSYGRMAQAFPSAGSAYSYVGSVFHPGLGFIAGWSIILDYLLNPVICTVWCSKAAQNFLPGVPFWVLALFFAALFTWLNLRGIETSAEVNRWMTIGMGAVIVLFLGTVVHYLMRQTGLTGASFLQPFYDPKTFSFPLLSSGTAIAVLTYIGFDSVSTLSEEVENPRRNVLLATVLTCLITGVLASVEVYAAQLVWPDWQHYPDVDTAFVFVAGRAGGAWLFAVVNLTLLIATVGSGFGSQLAAARLLFSMGRDNVIPRRFFGVLDATTRIPRNNVLLSGALTVAGSLVLSYETGAELLNFGAFIAFMGVNLAAFSHYCLRLGQRRWSAWFPPLAGFGVCLFIWLHLSVRAKTAGAIWLLAGIIYGATRGNFKRGEAAPSSQEA
jgi:putrescine importer